MYVRCPVRCAKTIYFSGIVWQFSAVHEQEVSSSKAAQLTAAKYLNFRKVTIYGGTNEIQKNIIAKAVLGL